MGADVDLFAGIPDRHDGISARCMEKRLAWRAEYERSDFAGRAGRIFVQPDWRHPSPGP